MYVYIDTIYGGDGNVLKRSGQIMNQKTIILFAEPTTSTSLRTVLDIKKISQSLKDLIGTLAEAKLSEKNVK